MAKHSLLVGLILLAGASLSACNRNSDSDALANDPFAARTSKDDQFGKGYGKKARVDPYAEPTNLVEGDMEPVSYTDEPIPTT